MSDKIVIVLAESSLPRNSRTKMPTADACKPTNPLACLELNLLPLARSPKRVGRTSDPDKGEKAHRMPLHFHFFIQTKVTLLYCKGTIEPGRACISGSHPLGKDLAYALRHVHIHIHTLTHSHTKKESWGRKTHSLQGTDYRQELMLQNIVLLDWF